MHLQLLQKYKEIVVREENILGRGPTVARVFLACIKHSLGRRRASHVSLASIKRTLGRRRASHVFLASITTRPVAQRARTAQRESFPTPTVRLLASRAFPVNSRTSWAKPYARCVR